MTAINSQECSLTYNRWIDRAEWEEKNSCRMSVMCKNLINLFGYSQWDALPLVLIFCSLRSAETCTDRSIYYDALVLWSNKWIQILLSSILLSVVGCVMPFRAVTRRGGQWTLLATVGLVASATTKPQAGIDRIQDEMKKKLHRSIHRPSIDGMFCHFRKITSFLLQHPPYLLALGWCCCGCKWLMTFDFNMNTESIS